MQFRSFVIELSEDFQTIESYRKNS